MAMAGGFFQGAVYSWHTVIFTLVGICILWGRWGRKRLRSLIPFADYIEIWVTSEKLRYPIEFGIFAFFGVLGAILIVKPTSATQCMAAGMGWTGIVSTLET